jgi:hypothetical protein
VANNNSLVWEWPPGPYDKMSNLNCNGEFRWINVKPEETVKDSFTVQNIGDSGSDLDWNIIEWPQGWGDWTFNPSYGYNLTPEDGQFIVEVEVVVPSEQNQQFNGNIKIVNNENSYDFCIISIFLSTSKNKETSSSLFLRFLEQFPLLNLLLQRLII